MDNKIYANPVGIIKKDIYVIKNDINNKVYVGQTKDIKKRFESHCKKTKDNSLIRKDIHKYGKQHFWVEILESQVENYDEREIYWIKKLNSQVPNGYNILAGGSEPPHFYGKDHPLSKMTNEDVENLKWDLANTRMPLSDLAKKYNISKRQVLHINNGDVRNQNDDTYPIRKEPNINGKLTDSDIDKIIHLLKYTYRFNGDIAREFHVDVHAIDRINNGITHHRDDIQYPIRKWKSSGVIPFTYEQVTEIIDKLQNTNISINRIAKEYGVCPSSIYQINTGHSKKYRRENIKYPIRSY